MFSSLRTAPPPVEMMRQQAEDASLITSASRSRKYGSPLVSINSLMAHPQRFSISASVSINSNPSRFKHWPIVLFPLPGIPIRTMFSLDARTEAYTLSAASFAMDVPRNLSTATTACMTSMNNPPSAFAPFFLASRIRFVESGLYTASITPSSASKAKTSMGLPAQSGYMPDGVVLMITCASACRLTACS